MRTLILAALAATTGLIPAIAEARGPTVRDGIRPVPNVRIHAPRPEAGTSWQAPAQRSDMRVERRRTVKDFHSDRRGFRNGYDGYRFIGRGGFVPSYWASPSYGISNYGMYGFGQPYGGARWVRYYDDALMVGPDGRVMDGRYGMDWDGYGDSWDHDDRGIPVYVGDGDYRPRYRDYAWSDRFDRDDDGELAYDRGYPYDHRYGGEGRGGPEGLGDDDRGGYGDASYGRYGQGYSGYGFGGYTVTETVTTTTGPSTVHYVDAPAPRKRYVKTKRRYSARKVHRAKSAAKCVCR